MSLAFATEVAATNPENSLSLPQDLTAKAAVYEEYAAFNLVYQKATDELFFNGQLVRYFEDIYPIGDHSCAGASNFNPNGVIDAHAMRDLKNIPRNADGSYDPSGKLIGIVPYSQLEFDARDLERLQEPCQISATNAGDALFIPENQDKGTSLPNLIVGTAKGTNQAGNMIADDTETASAGNPHLSSEAIAGTPVSPAELAKEYAVYAPFGVTYDQVTDRLYYGGKLVGAFMDVLFSNGQSPSSGKFSGAMRSINYADGEIDVEMPRDFTVLDAEGNWKLIGVKATPSATPGRNGMGL